MTSEGEKAKREGIARVLGKNAEWVAQVRSFCEAWISHGWIGSFEDVRHICKDSGIGEPTHPNAWGAVFHTMIILDPPPKKGTIRRFFRIYKGDDGREKWVTPKDRASHARPIKLYIKDDET